MRLPNGDKAFVADEKLAGYCLNLQHPRGRHKARAFAAKLGISKKNAEVHLLYSLTGECVMATQIRVLNVIALTADIPARDLVRGQVGTVVEQLSPEVFEVEFSDDNGKTYALCPISAEQMLVLHHEPAQVA